MKEVHAIWEKRNLGVDTIELTIEKDDNRTDIISKIESLNAEYIVIKVPSDYNNIFHDLNNMGYVFAESMNEISNNVCLKKLTGSKQDVLDASFLHLMNDDDVNNMHMRIVRDSMFHTDRVARDPYFGIQQANIRYSNWMTDAQKSGAQLYNLVYNDTIIGFLCMKYCGNYVYDDILTGIYKEHLHKGLAFLFPYTIQKYILSDQVKVKGQKVITQISSTNIASLNARLHYGYIIDACYYTFVKHNSL